MIFRTEAQKKDQALSWKRADRAFFASGACHILAHAFLQEYGAQRYRPYLILPLRGFRGEHIYAATGDTVFDYHGFSEKACFLEHYFRKLKRFFPGWNAIIVELNDFMTPAFFREFNYRAQTSILPIRFREPKHSYNENIFFLPLPHRISQRLRIENHESRNSPSQRDRCDEARRVDY